MLGSRWFARMGCVFDEWIEQRWCRLGITDWPRPLGTMVAEDWAFEIERRRGDRSEQRRILGSAWLCSDGRDELGTCSMVVKIRP
ncbi:hypothetical protein M0R45_002278 [Rubus argutus]|uniref:MHC class I antigen n=1 Tax=Rubus argutus TaxID=59490 RepID=A0AAW1VHS6_RUBAR